MPIFNRHYVSKGHIHQPDAMYLAGAVLEAQVHIPQPLINLMTAKGETLPAPISGMALIDTGATRTCVDEKILSRLGLNPVGVLTVGTAAGRSRNYLFPGRIELTTIHITLDTLMVGVALEGQEINNQPLIALLGRDLLRQGLLVYSGIGGFYTLGF